MKIRHKIRHKNYTLYFYRLSPDVPENHTEVATALCKFFVKHSRDKKHPTPHEPIKGHHIQIQDIVKVGNSIVGGVVKKFTNIDLPKKGVIGTVSEDEIELKQKESLIERTYFLYDFSNSVLLYQYNPLGTTYKNFSKYLITQRGAPPVHPHLEQVSFEVIPTSAGYDMLVQDNINMKKVSIRIPRPTRLSALNGIKNSWSRNLIDLASHVGGDLILTLKGDASPLINPRISNIIRSFRNSGVQGKLEIFDIDNIRHPIDLVAESLSATVKIPIKNRYPEPKVIIEKMKEAYDAKREPLKKFRHNIIKLDSMP